MTATLVCTKKIHHTTKRRSTSKFSWSPQQQLYRCYPDSVSTNNTKNDRSDPAKSPPFKNSTIAVPAHAPFCDPAIMLKLPTYPFVNAKSGMMVKGNTSAESQSRNRDCSERHARKSGTKTSRESEAVGSQALGRTTARPAANLPSKSNPLKDTNENITNTSAAKKRDRPRRHCRDDTICDVAAGNTDSVTVKTKNTANA